MPTYILAAVWFQTGVIHNIVHWCAQSCCFSVLRWGSKVYGYLVDASKAFDTVEHIILLEKLLSRGLPNVLVRFLPDPVFIRTKWNGLTSNAFSVSRGVRQGSGWSSFAYFVHSLHRQFAQGVVAFQCGLLLGEYLCWCLTLLLCTSQFFYSAIMIVKVKA